MLRFASRKAGSPESLGIVLARRLFVHASRRLLTTIVLVALRDWHCKRPVGCNGRAGLALSPVFAVAGSRFLAKLSADGRWVTLEADEKGILDAIMGNGATPCEVDQQPAHIGFLMVPDYTIVTLTNAVAVLRMANRLSERDLYRWSCLTLDGRPVASSAGLRLIPDGDTTCAGSLDILFVCGGYHPERRSGRPLLDTLRGFARRDVALGALCTGAHFLAAAGLLDGYRCAIHWENLTSLREQFPKVQVSSRLFVVDRDRYTCSGGVSSIDLMLNIVADAHGRQLAREISEQFVLERIRTEDDAQRTPLHYLIGAGNHQKLVDAVALMEANIEEPLALGELADYVDVSRRQLERLFHDHLHCTPSRYYLDLRLNRGRLLLLQTAFKISEVASRCGFSNAARFGKAYLARYDKRPSDERRAEP